MSEVTQNAEGTDVLKEAVVAVVGLLMVTQDALEDGFQLADSVSYFPILVTLPSLLKRKDLIVSQFKDMDEAERIDLLNFVKEKLVLKNKKVEKLVEQALIIILDVVKFIEISKEDEEAVPTA